MMDFRQTNIVRAKLACTAERYEDMAGAMSEIAQTGQPLDLDETKMLNYAFKQLVNRQRSSWRKISNAAMDVHLPELVKEQAKNYLEEIGEKLTDICKSVLQLVDEILLPRAFDEDHAERVVYNLVLKGDYYRYMVEIATDARRYDLVQEAGSAYASAIAIADPHLEPTNSVRLGLYLNYSIFIREMEGNADLGFHLASKAIGDILSSNVNISALDSQAKILFKSLSQYVIDLTQPSDY